MYTKELAWVFFYYVLLSTTLRWSKLHEMVPSRRVLSYLERSPYMYN